MSILDNLFGLWWVAIMSGVAAVTVAWWGWKGPHSTRAARWVLAVALAGLCVSYWWQIVASVPPPYDGPAEMRRASGIIWFPAMVWVAVTGMRQSRRKRERVESFVAVVFGHEVSDE